jgi:hypothetical protein
MNFNKQSILCVIVLADILYRFIVYYVNNIFYRTLWIYAVKYIYLAVLLSQCAAYEWDVSGIQSKTRPLIPNPNQLAYFAQIIFAAILILNHNTGKFYLVVRTDKFIRLSTIIVIILAHCYMILSASRLDYWYSLFGYPRFVEKEETVLTAFLFLN